MGDPYRAVAVYPILLKWIQRIVSSRLNMMRDMTRMWDSTQLGIRKGDGAAVLMLMMRSIVCALETYCVAQGFPEFAILSFDRWKCFPTFVMKYFDLVFQKAGIGAEHPLRRLAMDIHSGRTVYISEGVRSTVRDPVPGIKEGSCAAPNQYDLGALAFSEMYRDIIKELTKKKGLGAMKVIFPLIFNMQVPMDALMDERSRMTMNCLLFNAKFVDDELFFAPLVLVGEIVQKLSELMLTTGDWQNEQKRQVLELRQLLKEKQEWGQGHRDMKMVGGRILMDRERAAVLQKAAWIASQIPRDWRLNHSPEMVGYVVMSIFRSSILFTAENNVFDEAMVKQLKEIERDLLTTMLGEQLTRFGERYFPDSWLYFCSGILPIRTEVTVRRLLAIPKLAEVAKKREHKKEVQSAAVKVVFGRVVLDPLKDSFPTPVNTQFKSFSAMARGFDPIQQWKNILRQCGIVDQGRMASSVKFAKSVARAIAEEDMVNLSEFVSYDGYRFPEEEFRGKIAKITKCEQAGRACLSLARTQVFKPPQTFLKCKSCDFVCPGLDPRFDSHQKSRFEKIGGTFDWEYMEREWKQFKPMVCHEVKCWVSSGEADIPEEWTSHDSVCWDSPWALEAAEAADENEALCRNREDELRAQKFLICHPEDTEAFAQRLGRKKKFYTFEDAQVHRTHEKCGPNKKDNFPISVGSRGPVCLVCGRQFDLSRRSIELHKNLCLTPEHSFEVPESWDQLRARAVCDDWGWILDIAKEEAFGHEGWLDDKLHFERLQTILWKYAVPQVKFFCPESARGKRGASSESTSELGTKLVKFGLKTVTGSLSRREKKAIAARAKMGFDCRSFGISDFDYRAGRDENVKEKTEKWKIDLEIIKGLAEGHFSDVFGDPEEPVDEVHDGASQANTAVGDTAGVTKKRGRKKLSKKVKLQNDAKKIVRAAREKGATSLKAPRTLSHVSYGDKGIVSVTAFCKKASNQKCSQKSVDQPYSDALLVSRKKKFKRIWEELGSDPLVLLSDCTHWVDMNGKWALLNKLFACGAAKKVRLEEKKNQDFGF